MTSIQRLIGVSRPVLVGLRAAAAFALAGVAPLARRWERCRRDPVYARAVAAWRRYRRTARRDEESAWRIYLADRLALCAEALTADTVTEALRARNVDSDLIAEARQRFEEKDAVEYGRRPAASSESTRSLVRRLHKATVPLLLIAGLLFPLQADAADDAGELFRSGDADASGQT